ncbi:hypothetical protein FS749_002282 [Ceratobasidium sp. UAMH 11750]|nr:hypothetical protein FS749_002282 [Ceratobasidium sp. UAMH 11750]
MVEKRLDSDRSEEIVSKQNIKPCAMTTPPKSLKIALQHRVQDSRSPRTSWKGHPSKALYIVTFQESVLPARFNHVQSDHDEIR